VGCCEWSNGVGWLASQVDGNATRGDMLLPGTPTPVPAFVFVFMIATTNGSD
jgi:hypothetical protein